MELPPGIAFIFANAPRAILPPAIVLGGISICRTFFSAAIPVWIEVPLYLASFPLVLAGIFAYTDFRDKRRAATQGAVLATQVPNKWPGGLDRLLARTQNPRGRYLGEVVEKECREYGNTIALNILWESRIVTTEPEHIKAILATNFNSFAKGPVSHDILFSLLGTGVFNSDGDIWKFHRSMTRPFFTRDRINDFEIFEKHANDAIGQLKARLKQGYPVDFQDMISRFTLDSATEFLFGKDARSLSAGLIYPPKSPLAKNDAFQNHSANRFFHAFLEAQSKTVIRGRYGKNWRLREFWNDRVKKHVRTCYEFIDPILDDALSKKKSLKEARLVREDNAKEAIKEETLLDHLVNYTEDRTMIRDEILNIMIAGRDTTAATMTFAVWMLSQHRDALHKLRKEILTVVGDSRTPTLQDLRDMKYLRAVINETLRLYPPVPFNDRTSIESVVLPAGRGGQRVYVPPNTRVSYSVFLMHRRKDLWGPDADEFDPDRFLDERLHKYLTPNPFIFLPFNAGPRICLGQQFAYNKVSYFFVKLFQVISSVSLAEDVQTLAPAEWANAPGRKGVDKVIARNHLTIYVEDGLWVRMQEGGVENSLSS